MEHPYATGFKIGIEIPATIGIVTMSVRLARELTYTTDGPFKLGCIGAGALFAGLAIADGVTKHTSLLVDSVVRSYESATSQK